ncbi:28498_t:CDS:2, partial [Gigaspora margarita]
MPQQFKLQLDRLDWLSQFAALPLRLIVNTHRKDNPDDSKEGDTEETENFLAILCILNMTTMLGPYDVIKHPPSRHIG